MATGTCILQAIALKSLLLQTSELNEWQFNELEAEAEK